LRYPLVSCVARSLTVNGVSKAYAMTGWRVGYGGGPRELIAAMAVVQSQSTTNPSSVSQAAAIAAPTGPQQILRERRDAFQRRRDLVVDKLNAIDGVSCRRPAGRVPYLRKLRRPDRAPHA
jgi:aspartate aminotransferase